LALLNLFNEIAKLISNKTKLGKSQIDSSQRDVVTLQKTLKVLGYTKNNFKITGIFDNETAVETLMKFESRVEFFYQSAEEHEITSLASLWKKMNPNSIKRKKGNQFMKEQVGFMQTDQNEPISEVDKFFNKLKYIINIEELY
jgi:hypothetical protein